MEHMAQFRKGKKAGNYVLLLLEVDSSTTPETHCSSSLPCVYMLYACAYKHSGNQESRDANAPNGEVWEVRESWKYKAWKPPVVWSVSEEEEVPLAVQ